MNNVDKLFQNFTQKQINEEALFILTRLHTEDGWNVVNNLLSCFCGAYHSKGALFDAFSNEYKHRIYFLYSLLEAAQKDANFDKVFQSFKRATSASKIGFQAGDCERQIALLYVGVMHMNGMNPRAISHHTRLLNPQKNHEM